MEAFLTAFLIFALGSYGLIALFWSIPSLLMGEQLALLGLIGFVAGAIYGGFYPHGVERWQAAIVCGSMVCGAARIGYFLLDMRE